MKLRQLVAKPHEAVEDLMNLRNKPKPRQLLLTFMQPAARPACRTLFTGKCASIPPLLARMMLEPS
jgi:hypothetical protein